MKVNKNKYASKPTQPAEHAEPAGWIRICDKLPPENTEVIGWDGKRIHIVWCFYVDKKRKNVIWCRRDEGKDDKNEWDVKNITHWLDGVTK